MMEHPEETNHTDTDGKQSNLDRLVSLIDKDPQGRTEFECNAFVGFLKKHIEWFNGIKSELIKKIIKRCRFQRCPPGTVFIKQGDHGNSMYAILRGNVSVHVFFDVENEEECLAKVETAAEKIKYTKGDFGNEVAQIHGGSCIGEVALACEDNRRTATCLTMTECDFLVINRELYNVSVKEYIEREYDDKRKFVERNPLFRSWTPHQKNQLIISMRKTTVNFGDKLARQGHEMDSIYFIFKGDVEINIDCMMYKRQFPHIYSDLKVLLPDLVHDERPSCQAPHVELKERMTAHKSKQICILGENETIGTLEVLLGLDTYIETARATGECEVLVLKRTQFERMFKRKYALNTVEKLKEALANKLCLYIYQSAPQNVAFLKYLNMKLTDATVLQEVKRRKNAKVRTSINNNIGQEKMTREVDEHDIAELLKRLHMSTESGAQLPPEDMSEVALAKMDRRLRLWSEKTNMNGSKLSNLQTSSLSMSVHSSVA